MKKQKETSEDTVMEAVGVIFLGILIVAVGASCVLTWMTRVSIKNYDHTFNYQIKQIEQNARSEALSDFEDRLVRGDSYSFYEEGVQYTYEKVEAEVQ